jgi:hypothetical protein
MSRIHFLRAVFERPKRRQAAREVREALLKARERYGPTIGMDLASGDLDAVLIAEEAANMFPDLIIVRTASKVMLTFRSAWEANYAAAARAVLETERMVDRPALDDLKREHDAAERAK